MRLKQDGSDEDVRFGVVKPWERSWAIVLPPSVDVIGCWGAGGMIAMGSAVADAGKDGGVVAFANEDDVVIFAEVGLMDVESSAEKTNLASATEFSAGEP